MTRAELRTFLADFANSLTMMADRDAKDHAAVDAITALCEALTYRTEREFAEHCKTFDSHAVLARLDLASRERRESGPLGSPPEGRW